MVEKLKIAYFAFSEEYEAKHAGFTHSFNIVKSLAGIGLDVNAFFSSKQSLKSYGNLKLFNVVFPSLRNIFKTNPLQYFKSYFNVKKNILDADLIHERFHINPIDLFFIGNRKYLLEINDPAMVLHDSFLYRFLINLKLNRCDCIITQTKTLKEIISKYTNKPIYVIANGADTSKFKPGLKSDVRGNYGISNSDVLIVFAGAFMKWHGVLDAVKLAKRFPKQKFMMIGDGPEFNNAVLASKGLKNLILTGSKSNDEIPMFLSAADILIAPFNTKKFDKLDQYGFWWCPVKLFEYMASGKPIVSYDYYEVRNIVDGAGLLAKPGNLEDFSSKLKTLIENKKLRIKLGNIAAKKAIKYDWSHRAKSIYEVYKKCLKN